MATDTRGRTTRRAVTRLVALALAAACAWPTGHVLLGAPAAPRVAPDVAPRTVPRAAPRTVPPVAGTPSARPQAPAGTDWQADLRAWLAAVAAHEPGAADAPANTLGAWPTARLSQVRADFLALAGLVKFKAEQGAARAGVTYKGEVFTEAAVASLLGFVTGDDLNRVLARAAILHADIAMRVTPYRTDEAGCMAESAVLIVDGHVVSAGCVSAHLDLARALLDHRRPGRWIDAFTREWHVATIVWLLEVTDYANAWPQVDHASRLFPKDAVVAFEEGCYEAAMASPRVQLLRGTTLRVRSDYLRLAEASFRRALGLQPGFVEARVRLGAVLAELDRPRDAVDVLRQVDVKAGPRQVQYYAALFLARAEERLGHPDAARAHYERALAAVPTAHVPVLSLARLARGAGDRVQAERLVRHTLAAYASPPSPGDPWWQYHLWQIEGSDVLLPRLYQLVTSTGTEARPPGSHPHGPSQNRP